MNGQSDRYMRLLKRVGMAVFLLVTVFLFTGAAAVLAGDQSYCNGLVYIDSNANGVWDVGEAGYGGQYGVMEESEGEWVWRYRGALITFNPVDNTDPDNMIVLESAGYREAEEHENAFDVCTHQDLEQAVEDGYMPRRPCLGTFGFISFADHVTWDATIQVPEGYYLTSPQTIRFMTGGDVPLLDYGIAPLGTTPTPVVEPEPVAEPVLDTHITYAYHAEGTGYVYGLVFIDGNGDGIWNVGEAGYGGEYGVREHNDEWVWGYHGATVTLMLPGSDPDDAILLESAGYREPEEHETAFDVCTHQDYEADTDAGVNLHAVRPCVGTWGLVGAGDEVTWEVWVTPPAGYKLTSTNPQYYTTGSGKPPLDFGIMPLDNG